MLCMLVGLPIIDNVLGPSVVLILQLICKRL